MSEMQNRHWMGVTRLLWRTRRARQAGDPRALLRAVARGGQGAVGVRLRNRRVLLVLDPDLAGELLTGLAAISVKGPALRRAGSVLGDGLLTGEGTAHARARRLVAAAFSPKRLAGYTEVFTRCAGESAAGWEDGAARDIHAEMVALTLRTAGLTLLGTDLSTQASLVRDGLAAGDLNATAGVRMAGARASGLRAAVSRGAAIGIAGFEAANAAAARQTLHRLVDDIIAKRRAEPADDRGDVLAALLAASGPPDGLTAREIHDHVMTLLLAGFETTASALTWAIYLLGKHPEAQRELQLEADDLGGPPEHRDLATLPYARAVLSEALRLYPPAWIMGRELTADAELAGWRLPAGSVAAVSPLLLHHDPRWYPDPERFDPERWIEPRHPLPKNAFLPFGVGPRACIGEQFAWAEGIAVLAAIAQLWTFHTETGPEPALRYGITLRPAVPVLVTAYARATDTAR